MISSGAKFLRAYVRKIYIRKLTMHERWLVNVKVEPRSTSCINSSLFILPLFYLRDYHLRALTCVAKNASVEINLYCLNFCTVMRGYMDTWQLSWETPTYNSSVPCEQGKNIERPRVNEMSGQFFSQKFVRCHLRQTTIVSLYHMSKLFLYVGIYCSCIFIKMRFYCLFRP